MRRPAVPSAARLAAAAALALVALAAGCARSASERPGGDTAVVTPGGAAPDGKAATPPTDPGVIAYPGTANPSAQDDLAAVQRLEREARALARTEGCASIAQCTTAPVGSRPCGGPRTHIPYCRLTTDSVALYAKLDELARRERAYNEKLGMASTCELRTPPDPTYAGGRCGPASAP